MRHLVATSILLLAACDENIARAPEPPPLTAETVAHYCMMDISAHPGPKTQIFLSGLPDPIFFAQVRDAFAYLASAEQDGYVAAVYVNDMSAGPWASPGAANWTPADEARYVVGSDKVGGMGAPELVPFSKETSAAAFAATHGGTIHQMHDVPEDAFLAPFDLVFQTEDEG